MKNLLVLAIAIPIVTWQLLLTPSVALADSYQFCYPVKRVRILRDPGNHPNAYDDGYREGAENDREGEAYEPRTAGGEFARGFDDGYYGRPYASQQNTVLDRSENYMASQCNNYYYDRDDEINEILNSVVSQIERDLRRDWGIDFY